MQLSLYLFRDNVESGVDDDTRAILLCYEVKQLQYILVDYYVC